MFNCILFRVLGAVVYGLDELPPTGSQIRGHIHRACDLIYDANHLISEPADAFSAQQKLLHGWENKNGLLVPTKYLKPLPENILFTCGCATTCDTKRCKCFNNDLRCVPYCHGKLTVTACKRLQIIWFQQGVLFDSREHFLTIKMI